MTNPKVFIENLNTAQTLLGLDFGDKTIGIAVSDKSLTIASPIKTIRRKSISKDLIELFDLIEVYNVGGLIVGLPLSLNGKENIRTEKVRKFVNAIELQKNIKIMLYDERFSSDVIFKELRKNHNSISKIKKKLDQQAAAYILQGFLDSSKKN
ncbi:MAG: Holliday junction resolvase RuvX [Candidatus Pelagibacter sp.]|jgi:putative Holliday junction resolvase|nr:Holliday junction resolvase RuvX [Candidatus Pelagibacter sp.]|tara:strand:+ start:1706 stop:2164 length:459 start_codon:yes stop_codon:yes gene_type:complete